MNRFSEEFKSSLIKKSLLPGGPSLSSLAKDHDIPVTTVYGWRKKYTMVLCMENQIETKTALNGHLNKNFKHLLKLPLLTKMNSANISVKMDSIALTWPSGKRIFIAHKKVLDAQRKTLKLLSFLKKLSPLKKTSVTKKKLSLKCLRV